MNQKVSQWLHNPGKKFTFFIYKFDKFDIVQTNIDTL